MIEKRINNLDGLRFVAAVIVLICHAEIIKTFFGFEALTGRFFHNSAQLAVTFFFVLSGFLITWLLVSEKQKDRKGKLQVLHFYKKRILRIWPLYYLLLALTFFVFTRYELFFTPYSGVHTYDTPLFWNRFYGYLFWLPNYTDLKYGSVLYMGQTWSLAVEEFFYLLFPLAIHWVPYKKIRSFLFFVTILFLVISIGMRLILLTGENHGNLIKVAGIYADKYRIYSFSLGAIAAYYWMHPHEIPVTVRYFLTKNWSNAVVIFLSAMMMAGLTFSILTQQIYSLLFAAFLFIVTITHRRYWFLNHPVMIYLGKISYGIYMFHPFAIVLAMQLLKERIGKDDVIVSAITIDGIALIITIGLAIISYELYEKIFLRMARNKKKIANE